MANNVEPNLKILAKAILKLRDVKEAENFLSDLLSNYEVIAISARLNAALMLSAGESYIDIERKTGMSSATIAKISESLKYGKEGYKTIIERMKKSKI
jgi:TrpR-related protein YerC/YecD